MTDAVHAEGGKIALQILHAGRYGYSPAVRSSIATEIADHAVHAARTERGIERQIRSFVRCAGLAREGGYDGVEIMGPRATSSTSSDQLYQSPYRRMGRQLRNRMAASRDRPPRTRGSGARLHHLPPVADRSGAWRQRVE